MNLLFNLDMLKVIRKIIKSAKQSLMLCLFKTYNGLE